MPISSDSTFADLVNYIISLISLLIPFIFGLIMLFIVWRVVDAWIIHGGDETKVKEGKQTLVIGIIVLVILSGIWGILSLLRSSFFGI